MVKMTCPVTGAVVYVAENRVEKHEKAGYKRWNVALDAEKSNECEEPTPDAPEVPKPGTKPALIAECEELGIELTGEETKAALEELIKAHKAE